MSSPRVRPTGSRRKCQYKGCNNVKKDCVGKRFFCFPNPDKKPELFKQWIINTENLQILESTAKNYLHKTVCEDHFKDSSFRNAKRVKLWPNAVPEPRPYTRSDSPPPDQQQAVFDSPLGNIWETSSSSSESMTILDSPRGNQWTTDSPAPPGKGCSS